MTEIVAGKGISRYISGVGGRGLDVVYNPETGAYETLPLAGGSLSFVHFWSGAFFSYLTVGLTYVRDADFETGDAFSNSQYLAGNLFWEPYPGRRVGLEDSFTAFTPRLVAMTALLVLVLGMILSLVPAVRAARRDVLASLRFTG